MFMRNEQEVPFPQCDSNYSNRQLAHAGWKAEPLLFLELLEDALLSVYPKYFDPGTQIP